MKNLAIMTGFNADLMMTRDSSLLFLGHPVDVCSPQIT